MTNVNLDAIEIGDYISGFSPCNARAFPQNATTVRERLVCGRVVMITTIADGAKIFSIRKTERSNRAQIPGHKVTLHESSVKA
jgi:hypothetical protein